MRRAVGWAVLAMLAAPSPVLPAASAAPRPATCRVIADAAGDVRTFGPAPAQTVDDEHVDVRAVEVAQARGALLVTFRGTAMDPFRLGGWRLAFTARGKRVYAIANLGQWNNYGNPYPTYGFYAGVVGGDEVKVTGAFDFEASTATVTVPLAAFGPHAPRKRDRLTSFAFEAREELLFVSPSGGRPATVDAGLGDWGGSSSSLVIGGECRAR